MKLAIVNNLFIAAGTDMWVVCCAKGISCLPSSDVDMSTQDQVKFHFKRIVSWLIRTPNCVLP